MHLIHPHDRVDSIRRGLAFHPHGGSRFLVNVCDREISPVLPDARAAVAYAVRAVADMETVSRR